MVGTDYPAQHSTSGILQGMEQEMPTTNGFNAGGNGTNDPTGSTCAYTTAATDASRPATRPRARTTDRSSHIGGIPNHFQGSAGTGCPAPTSATGAGGCTLSQAVFNGVVSLVVVQAGPGARALPGGALRDARLRPDPDADVHQPRRHRRRPQRALADPVGPTGASPTTDLGTENGDAGVAELTAEEGAVLFKNASRSTGATPELPIKSSDLTSNNIFVTGPGAEYLIASPSREASQGFPNRITSTRCRCSSRSAATRTRSRTPRR